MVGKRVKLYLKYMEVDVNSFFNSHPTFPVPRVNSKFDILNITGLIYCCVGTLSICKRMDALKADELAWWLCERQLPSGGLNGRPEKLPDLCYSWYD